MGRSQLGSIGDLRKRPGCAAWRSSDAHPAQHQARLGRHLPQSAGTGSYPATPRPPKSATPPYGTGCRDLSASTLTNQPGWKQIVVEQASPLAKHPGAADSMVTENTQRKRAFFPKSQGLITAKACPCRLLMPGHRSFSAELCLRPLASGYVPLVPAPGYDGVP